MNNVTAGFDTTPFRLLRSEGFLSPSTTADWWRGAVIYQVYPRSFADGNGDGIGDLPGLLGRLGHIADLGADAIWISPFQCSPQEDYGYDVSDYCDVDPLFGTLADFDRVLARAYQLGLKVLMDQVWSHSSSQHPWFQESRASRHNPRSDWYVWADPSPDGTAPTNWLSVFGGPAWSWEPRRRQYYLHHFLGSQPAFNLHNGEVVEALLDIGRFWLDRGVDGFRLDAVDWMCHDPDLRDNPAAHRPGQPVPAKPFGMQLHQHDLLHPRTLEVIARIRGLQDEYPGTATLAEISSQDGAFDRLRRYTAPGMFDMAYTLRFMKGNLTHETVASTLHWMTEHQEGWPCWSFSNHDVERVASRWSPIGGQPGQPSPEFLRLLMAMLLTMRGSVCLYLGEELGLTEAELRPEDLRDPFGIAFWPDYKGRDGSRTPMPWQQDAPHLGFSTGGSGTRPWLPMPEAHHPLAAEAQRRDPGSTLNAWRHFLRFRRNHPALVHGTLAQVAAPEPLICFRRHSAEESLLCVFNLGNAPREFDLPAEGLVEPLWSSAARLASGPRAALGPCGVLILRDGPAVAE